MPIKNISESTIDTLVIYAKAGVGKTYFSNSISQHTLNFVFEDGVSSIPVNDNTLTLTTNSAGNIIDNLNSAVQEFNEFITTKAWKRIKVVTIDSLTALQHLAEKEVVDEHNKFKKPKIKSVADITYGVGYANAKEKVKDFVNKIKAQCKISKKLLVITARETEVVHKDDDDKVSFYTFEPQVSKAIRNDYLANDFSLIVNLGRDFTTFKGRKTMAKEARIRVSDNGTYEVKHRYPKIFPQGTAENPIVDYTIPEFIAILRENSVFTPPQTPDLTNEGA